MSAALITDYGDLYYQKDGEDKSFIKRWVKDKDKRAVTEVVFTPSAACEPERRHQPVPGLWAVH